MIFHIDGNSFYAACERVFRPDLAGSPIAVLSNNDGIVVALNAECKKLGFKRGDVFFEVKQKFKERGVVVFSSNYTLYADMSARMNLIYCQFTPDVEVYSIDESFLFFQDMDADYSAIAAEVKAAVTRDTGIPVSIGVAPNKTLAKMCNKLAKKRGGVFDWQKLDQSGQDEELERFPVEDVWGIGWSKASLLKKQGITTALALKNYPLLKAKKFLTVTGYRTVQELNGISAIDKIEEKPRQVIMVSRSFQSAVYELDDIITALSEYTQEAVGRMRDEGLSCKYVSVYLMTNAYAKGDQYFNSLSAELPYLSAYLPEIQSVANELVKRIFRPDYKYRKVMIGLTGLAFDNCRQFDLFDTSYNRKKLNEPLMRTFDTINNRYGRGTIKLACGLGKKPQNESEEIQAESKAAPWELRREYLSPRYTTNIKEIPLVM